jgi:hypothetical protein
MNDLIKRLVSYDNSHTKRVEPLYLENADLLRKILFSQNYVRHRNELILVEEVARHIRNIPIFRDSLSFVQHHEQVETLIWHEFVRREVTGFLKLVPWKKLSVLMFMNYYFRFVFLLVTDTDRFEDHFTVLEQRKRLNPCTPPEDVTILLPEAHSLSKGVGKIVRDRIGNYAVVIWEEERVLKHDSKQNRCRGRQVASKTA